MKLVPMLFFCAALAFAGCAKVATVKERPSQNPGVAIDLEDPAKVLGDSVRAAEAALRKLGTNPGDDTARRNYNFAVARICGAIRDQKLAPWDAPIRAGSHTL